MHIPNSKLYFGTMLEGYGGEAETGRRKQEIAQPLVARAPSDSQARGEVVSGGEESYFPDLGLGP